MTVATPADGPARPDIGGTGRIEGLVVWRALLMLAGLPLHAVVGDEHYPAFEAIGFVSGSFRMGTFFAISGLLSGFALMRRARTSEWLRRRLVRLGAPALVGLATISPLVGWIIGAANPFWPIVPYHLWFLIGLLGYSVLGCAVHRIDRRWPIFDRVERRSQRARRLQAAVLLCTGLLSFVLMAVGGAIHGIAPVDARPTTTHLPLIVGYVPLFLLGFAAARSPTLRRGLVADWRVPAIIIALAAGGYLVLHLPGAAGLPPGRSAWWNDLLEVASAAWCPPAATALILRSAAAMRRVPALFHRLADASFTMYLLHFPVIVAVKMAIRPLHLTVWGGFAVAIVAGGTLSYAIHRRIVSRVPVLDLLIGGRLPSSRHGIDPGTASAMEGPAIGAGDQGGELLLPGAPRTAGIPFCCPVGSDRAILE